MKQLLFAMLLTIMLSMPSFAQDTKNGCGVLKKGSIICYNLGTSLNKNLMALVGDDSKPCIITNSDERIDEQTGYMRHVVNIRLVNPYMQRGIWTNKENVIYDYPNSCKKK